MEILLLIFLSLSSTLCRAESLYRVERFQSKFFTAQDKEKLREYFQDDYLVKKKTQEFEMGGQKFFHFLSASIATELREEVKQNPFGDLLWPDNLDLLDLYLIELEQENLR
ncbi:MAG: hypothetical protein ACOYL6_10660 [Bacteriovoracaceae bacterium]